MIGGSEVHLPRTLGIGLRPLNGRTSRWLSSFGTPCVADWTASRRRDLLGPRAPKARLDRLAKPPRSPERPLRLATGW